MDSRSLKERATVHRGHNEQVALPEVVQGLAKPLAAVYALPGGFIGEDLVAAAYREALPVEVLVCRTHAHVPTRCPV